MTPEAYDLADALAALAPWNWMGEDQLIAIRHPETGRLDHISIMGAAGNHFSLALYLGAEARQRFNLMQSDMYDNSPLTQADTLSLILDTPQLQASFSERADLFKSELAAIKKHGRKYSGDDWPSFRSFSPGHCPIPANPQESAWLCTAIRQVLEVAPSLRLSDTYRYDRGPIEILTRECLDGTWQTTWNEDDGSPFSFPQPEPNAFLLEKIRRHPRDVPLEVHFQLVPNPVGKSRETSLFPYLLLVVEPKSHFVLGASMLSIENQPYETLIATLPDEFLRVCDKHAIRPSSIAVASPATHCLLVNTAAALDIPCKLQKRLPAIDDALGSLMNFMGGVD
ncbi:MAG: hypothetical protein WCP45_13365 [Verrucomicrobiota bacterium]